ncbi:ribonuclease R [Kangiella profundi]|uniref:Ribonuclease R n=1 Tax=Kangiella profundi TaxID=1561924 RepID=A0A2K9AGT0_9GAMM|nr:ribonuclease R [Kangiella profundi]AUD78164.1 ribonuclease R [Kangiella profundi]GGF05633.1 ribonuclease R [Kangiella profundi]
MSKRKNQDPQAELEAQRYQNPIASRQFILRQLEEAGEPVSLDQLAKRLEMKEPEQVEALQKRLNAMERDGQLICNRKGRYCLVDATDLVRGKVLAHRDGYGYLALEKGGDDWYLSPREMQTVFHGDKVLARVRNVDRRGRTEGAIVEILDGSTSHIVGRLNEENGMKFVTSEDPRILHDLIIAPDDCMNAEIGQVVVAQIVQRPKRNQHARGIITEVLGDYLSAGMEIEIAIRNHQIPYEWPDDVLSEVGELPVEVTEKDWQGRVDLRQLPLVTIDGEDARDFDDAVYCRRKAKGGWTLWVAIADVSHYVRPGSALDQEALERGNSVYFPEFVVPMLPELLSNGLCSLKPKVDRLCMVAEMSLTATGQVTASKFYPAVMHSHARFTYDKVWGILSGDEALQKEYAPLVGDLKELHELFKARLKLKEARGAIEFETTETQIIFDENKKIEKIVGRVRNDAHKIIEECMICANVAAAEFIEKHEKPGVYRVHEGPSEERLEKFRAFLGELGIFLFGGSTPEPRHYRELHDAIAERPDQELIQTMMLRSMMQAVYSPDNQGHFGLAFDSYTHFTSPIRRYPDLLVHRIIKAILAREFEMAGTDGGIEYEEKELVAFTEHSSMTERRADLATRDVVDWLKCEYMLTRVGEEYWGTISSVTSFGIFVALDELFVEGLIHISELGDDYYHFDALKMRLIGEHKRQSYRVGDRVKIKVANVDMEQRNIDFALIEREYVKREEPKGQERKKLYAKAKKSGSLSGDGKKGKDGKKRRDYRKGAAKGSKPASGSAKKGAKNTKPKRGKNGKKKSK